MEWRPRPPCPAPPSTPPPSHHLDPPKLPDVGARESGNKFLPQPTFTCFRHLCSHVGFAFLSRASLCVAYIRNTIMNGWTSSFETVIYKPSGWEKGVFLDHKNNCPLKHNLYVADSPFLVNKRCYCPPAALPSCDCHVIVILQILPLLLRYTLCVLWSQIFSHYLFATLIIHTAV